MDLIFADEESPSADSATKTPKKPWCILLVDDDAEVHAVTRLALKGFEFQGSELELLSAHSGQAGREVFQLRDDIALAIVDVVMETDHAGLDLVHYVRNTLENHRTRLVMRTGQPGQAPEDRVIREFDIDDYKEKTDLTIQKLRTLLYSKLRAYRDLCIIEYQRDGLARVLGATAMVQTAESLTVFATAVLDQLTSLLHLDRSALYCIVLPNADSGENETKTIAATGDFVQYSTNQTCADLPDIVSQRFKEVFAKKSAQHFDDAYVLYTNAKNGGGNLLYLKHATELSKMDRQLLEIYTQSVAITFDNINLQEHLRETQKELVYTLADAVEARTQKTGAHVKRVSLSCELLARLYGLPEAQTLLIKNASPLHDIGKVAIPDSILHKPGKLNAEEWALMQQHAQFGLDILKRSNRALMKLAAEIALSHHERWDGTGYPNGLSGMAIPVSGRITALADVFDSLGSRLSYKEPWSQDLVEKTIREASGKQFEPALVDLLLANLDTFSALREQYPDDLEVTPSNTTQH
jgi:response regulator RpfG family c-di-GMP phosphodiesterase